ncbi:NLI interacting factor-like phosphatase [Gracilaria domingensis]|nr:NLI interacting factor-like phosphatase [Gracilaria domingensis]
MQAAPGADQWPCVRCAPSTTTNAAAAGRAPDLAGGYDADLLAVRAIFVADMQRAGNHSLLSTPLVITRVSYSLLKRRVAQHSAQQPHRTHTTHDTNPQHSQQHSSKWTLRNVVLASGIAAIVGVSVSPQTRSDIQNALQRTKHNIDERINFFTKPSREKLLPDLPKHASHVRTLVIDLEDTLVHCSYSRARGWRIAKRPGAEAFLAYMATFYEVVVFTSNLHSFADPILNKLDPNGYVVHRLYRHDTHYQHGVHIKDVSALNRDLSRVIVIDHDEKHTSLQPENAIIIPKWTGDTSDTTLLDLIPMLESLVRRDVADVREHIDILKGKPLIEGVAEYRALESVNASRSRSAAGSLFGRSAGTEAGAVPDGGAMGGEGEGADDGGRRASGAVWGSLSGSGMFSSRSSQSAGDDKR